MSSDELDPLLTDEQIIRGFNSLELKFYQWYANGGMRAAQDRQMQGASDELQKAIEQKWPNEDDVFEKFHVFVTKWCGRHRRRMERPMSRKELLDRVRNTECKTSNSLAKTLWVMNLQNTPDLTLGESNFGGVLTGYALIVDCHILFPDASGKKSNFKDDPYLLDRAVMALDGDLDPVGSAQILQSSLAAPMQALQVGKRRRENRSDDSTDTNVSTRTADSGDFEDQSPFCFLQIGSLHYCSGEDWLKVRNDPEAEADALWEGTGYVVIVKLSRSGHPTGPVYVVYNFHRRRTGIIPPKEDNPIYEEIESRGLRNIELPHIRRLYPNCNRKFFLAKIANNLEDLDEGVVFDFQIEREAKCPLVRTKCVSVHQMIIPDRITTQSSADKRFRAD